MTSPTVLDVRRYEGRLLARVETGDVSVLVEAPEHVSEAELDTALEHVPETLVEYADRVVADGGRDTCRQCGDSPERWEHLTDGLCPACWRRYNRDRLVPDGGPRLRPEWTAEDVERELNAVLDNAENDEARYHARQALQHLKVFEHTEGEQP
jgi:hypothetical protein